LRNTDIKRDCRNSCNINLSVSSLLRLKKWSYVEQALAYPISWEMYTPYAGDSGMLLHIYGKLAMVKLKPSLLSYNWVVSFLSASMFSRTFKYDAEVRGCVKDTLQEMLVVNYMCLIFSSLFIIKDQIISMKLFRISTTQFHVGIQVISLELMHVSLHGV
jgi:hypothetical protein